MQHAAVRIVGRWLRHGDDTDAGAHAPNSSPVPATWLPILAAKRVEASGSLRTHLCILLLRAGVCPSLFLQEPLTSVVQVYGSFRK